MAEPNTALDAATHDTHRGREQCSSTPSKLTAETCLASEGELQAFAELAPIGIFKQDIDGCIVYANQAWHKLFGLEQEQDLSPDWLERVHPEDVAAVLQEWERANQEIAPRNFEMEFRVCHPHDEVRYLLLRARPIALQSIALRPDRPMCFIGCVEDITNVRRMEQEHNEHCVILERSLNEIFIFDADSLRFEFVNEGARRNLGYGSQELAAMTPVDIKPEFDLDSFQSIVEPLRTGQQDFMVFQTVHRRANGSDYAVEVRLQMSKKANRPVFLAIALDITDRLAFEAENQKASTLQRAILDHAAYAIIATTPTGLVTRFNPAAERLLGYSSAEMVGRSTPAAFHLESEVVARADEFSRELEMDLAPGFDVFVIKSRLGMANEHEWTYVRKDGTHVPVLLSVTTIRDDSDEIVGYLGIAKDITKNRLMEAQLAAAAVTDQLTGLPNRAPLLERLQVAIQRSRHGGHHFALMFLDFDRFKSVNDSWGHDVGDALLRQIADRLHEAVDTPEAAGQKTTTIARLGGDEFVVFVDQLRGRSDCDGIVERMHDVLSDPYQLGEYQCCCTASIGIVVGPSNYERAEDVLRDADTAMYEAKHAGRARHVVFDKKMHTRVHRRLQIENHLRDAIGTDQLCLHYQPIVSLVTGEIASVEALLRWHSPTLGHISPVEFIPIAQESNIILRLGEWVLEEGCRQFADWQRTLGRLAPPQISINLARKQFADPRLVDAISRILTSSGVRPECLQLEVTEEAFALNVDDAVKIMNSIKSLGVKLAIDDFGSGTASFVALHQFPVDVLKVDRSLVKKIEKCTGEAALLHGLVVMARNLNIKLVAEGIETIDQLKAVQELGCDLLQGYYFAKPMPDDQLCDFMASNDAFLRMATGAMSFAGGWTERMRYMVPAAP